MNRMISFARIMFAGLGIYLSIAIVSNVMFTFNVMFQQPKWEIVGVLAIHLLVSMVMLLAVIYLLIVKGDKWAHKLIAKDIAAGTPLNIDLTLTMAFRLVCVGAGLLCLRSFVYRASYIVFHIITIMKSPSAITGKFNEIFSGGLKVDYIHYIQPLAYVLFAAYLLCGAPHFVRWQVKRTLKFCEQK